MYREKILCREKENSSDITLITFQSNNSCVNIHTIKLIKQLKITFNWYSDKETKILGGPNST